jgi:hypothetical protein
MRRARAQVKPSGPGGRLVLRERHGDHDVELGLPALDMVPKGTVELGLGPVFRPASLKRRQCRSDMSSLML